MRARLFALIGAGLLSAVQLGAAQATSAPPSQGKAASTKTSAKKPAAAKSSGAGSSSSKAAGPPTPPASPQSGGSPSPGPLAATSSASEPATIAAKPKGAFARAAEARSQKKISDRYDPVFRKYTKRYFGPTFDWKYFKAQGFAESGLKPSAVSWVGARGVMQLMPSTFQMISSARPEFSSIDDPEWNIAAGIMHDRYLWKLWDEKVPEEEQHRFMFASYNAGEGTINRARGVALTKLGATGWDNIERVAPSVTRWRYLETLGYVKRIDSTYAAMTGPLRP